MFTLAQALKAKRDYFDLDGRLSYKKMEQKIHSRTQGMFLADAVYGSLDGIVTTFAAIAGGVGANLSREAILVIGFANLVADGFSMAVGNYLGKRSENMYFERQKKVEKMEQRRFRPVQYDELREVYEKKGFKGEQLEKIVKTISEDKNLWAEEILQECAGLVDQDNKPFWSASVTFLAFGFAGFLPLIPFLFGLKVNFFENLALVSLILFFIGSKRSKFTLSSWWRNGLEIMLAGIGTAFIAYAVGLLLGRIL